MKIYIFIRIADFQFAISCTLKQIKLHLYRIHLSNTEARKEIDQNKHWNFLPWSPWYKRRDHQDVSDICVRSPRYKLFMFVKIEIVVYLRGKTKLQCRGLLINFVVQYVTYLVGLVSGICEKHVSNYDLIEWLCPVDGVYEYMVHIDS